MRPIRTATLFLPAAHAISCFNGGGKSNCLTREGFWELREKFCSGGYWKAANNLVVRDSRNGNYGQVITSGGLETISECWSGLYEIFNACFGKKNGGSIDIAGQTVTLDYCYG